MYIIELSQKAQKNLDKLDKDLKQRIENKLRNLRENPVPPDSKFIGRVNTSKLFRYRIGNYRALYLLKEKDKIVLITKISKRSKVYKE